MKMLAPIFVSMILVFGAAAQVIITVTPAIVEPGFTPFVAIRCSVLEQEEGTIVSISLLRQVVPESSAVVPRRELVAELPGQEPAVPRLAPGFQNVTILGQIAPVESEVVGGTYLEVVIPEPKVQDLGLYTCEATAIGEIGGLTYFSEARLTTSNPVTDRLLSVVFALEEDVNRLNRSLSQVQSQIDAITAAKDKESVAAATTPSTEEKTTYGVNTTTEQVTTPKVERSTVDTPPKSQAGQDLARLTAAIVFLEDKFDLFNQTLVRLNRLISTLERRAEVPRQTRNVQDIPAVIRNFFTLGNTSYILFQTTQNSEAYRAQSACESKKLQLAVINITEELVAVTKEISPFVSVGGVVFVGDELQLGQEQVVFSGNQDQVEQVAPEPDQKEPTTIAVCLTLQKSNEGLNEVPVDCAAVQVNVYFLCQSEANSN